MGPGGERAGHEEGCVDRDTVSLCLLLGPESQSRSHTALNDYIYDTTS